MHSGHPAVPGQESVEGSMHCRVGPSGGSAETDSLAKGMDACIGSAGSMGNGASPKEPLQNPLEFSLNRAARGLALPTDKAGAVVLECGKEGPAHLPKI
jgi:hypothetical protein